MMEWYLMFDFGFWIGRVAINRNFIFSIQNPKSSIQNQESAIFYHSTPLKEKLETKNPTYYALLQSYLL